LQRGNAQRKADRLEARGFQSFLQPENVVPGNRDLRGVGFTGGRAKARIGNQQSVRSVRKTSLGFDLQKAAHVGFRQLRDLRVQRERPTQGDADDATAFANPGFFESIPNLLSHEFGVIGQRIE